MLVKGIVSAVYAEEKKISVILPEFYNLTTVPLQIYGDTNIGDYSVNDFVVVLVFNDDFSDAMVLSKYDTADETIKAEIEELQKRPITYIVPFYENPTDAQEAEMYGIAQQIKADNGKCAVFINDSGKIIPAEYNFSRFITIRAASHIAGSTSYAYEIQARAASNVTTYKKALFAYDMLNATEDVSYRAPTCSAVAAFIEDYVKTYVDEKLAN